MDTPIRTLLVGDLNDRNLRRYLGGFLEIVNESRVTKAYYKGPIKAILVDRRDRREPILRVEFEWCARSTDSPENGEHRRKWVEDERRSFAVTFPMVIAVVKGDNGILVVSCTLTEGDRLLETAIFLPRHMLQLDRTKVEACTA